MYLRLIPSLSSLLPCSLGTLYTEPRDTFLLKHASTPHMEHVRRKDTQRKEIVRVEWGVPVSQTTLITPSYQMLNLPILRDEMCLRPFCPLGSLSLLQSSCNFEVLSLSQYIQEWHLRSKYYYWKLFFINYSGQPGLLRRILPVTDALISHHSVPWQIVFLESEQCFVAADMINMLYRTHPI